MESPNHNFLNDNKIVTCNSHAVGYAMTAYRTAYCKAHFPLEFFTSYLSFASYKQKPREEIYELVQDARYFNIDVMPPNITHGNIDFMIRDGKVIFGLSHIKGIGRSAIKSLVKGNLQLATWNDFLKNVPVLHRNVAAALIKSGACDVYGIPRNRMLKELVIVLGDRVLNEEGKWKNITGFSKKERSFFVSNYGNDDNLGNFMEGMISNKVPQKNRIPVLAERVQLLNEEDKDSNTEKALAEKHYLGIPLSCSVVDDIEEKGTHTCLQAAKALHKSNVNICGVIEKIKVTKTKRGKNPGQIMCFLTIADSTYSLASVVVFPNIFDEVKEFLKEDTIVLIYGEKRDRSIICSEIHKIL
jgi:DNA polymerase-3 subunit alpha